MRFDVNRVHGLAAGMALMASWMSTAFAAAPVAQSQPGFYRLQVGDFQVTALNDGVVAYNTKRLLPTATAQQVMEGLAENAVTDPVGMSYDAYLINTGTKLILIDSGTGGKFDNLPEFHGTGHLMRNLDAAGYRPEQIDEVYITHLGPDHVGGLTIDAKRAFPNAVLRAPKLEVDLFQHPETAPAWTKNWTRFWADSFAPYIEAGKFRSFADDIELTPGIRALGTHGHAPGHTSYMVESRGHALIVMGDLVLVQALQFAHPELGSSFDSDPKAAADQRIRVFKLAAESGDWVAGAHLSFPGLGHIRAAQDRYFWIPAQYSVSE